MIVASVVNAMLDLLNTHASHSSLHSAYSATGASEAAVTRQANSWAAAAGKSKSLQATLPSFSNVPAGTYRWHSFYNALTAGTFAGMVPLGGSPKEFVMDATANTIRSTAHGFVANDKIVFYGGAPPTGLTEGVVYFAITIAANTFQVSATSGGAAIALSGTPGTDCKVSKISELVLSEAGTINITGSTFTLDR